MYKQEPYRFVNATIFCISGIANSFIVQALSTISEQIQDYFSVSETQVNLCALVFMIIHPFMSFVANFVLNKYGLKIGCSINSALVIVGILVRLLVKINFAFVLAGNFIIAFGNVFMINSPSLLSSNWFRSERRLIVTSLAVFAASVSGGIGAFISPMFVKKGLPQNEGKQQVFNLILFQAILVGGVMLINLLFLRDKPSTPAGPASQRKLEPFGQSFKQLIKNKNYTLLFISFALVIGGVNALFVIIQPCLSPFGYTSGQVGITVILSVIAGLSGSIIFSIIIKINKKYKFTITLEIVIAALSFLVLLSGLLLKVKVIFWIGLFALSFFLYPAIPGMLELGCQLVFPISQPISSGFLLAGGQLFSFLIGLSFSYLVDGKSQKSSIIGLLLNISIILISLAVFYFVKEDMRRRDYESERQQEKLISSVAQQHNVQ